METKIIDEQLEDKQQIVTYKFLIQKLYIHPNKAKQLLKDYVSKLADSKKYSTTIVIGGTLKENDEFCIVLAYDDHVETMRRRFKQIDFEHIYSIQPINRLSDINNALYLVDNPENNHVNLASSIKKKEKGNILIHKQSVDSAMEIDLPSTKQTQSSPNETLNHINETQKKKTGLDFFAKNNKNNDTKSKETTEIKVIPKKNNSDFFAKFKKSNNLDNTKPDSENKVSVENVIKEDNKEIVMNSPKNNNTKSKETKIKVIPKNNHSDFAKFTKSINSDNTKSDSENEVSIENVIKDNKEIVIDYLKKNVREHLTGELEMKNIKKLDVKSPKKTEQEHSTSEKHEVKDNKKSNKKKAKGNKINNQKIKRKRIQTFDSSDEEIDSEEEDKKRSDHIMDMDDEVDFVQPTPPRPTPRENRKKEKQITTSTFIDDDGFVCTTKEVKFVETEKEPPESFGNVENSEPKELNIEPVSKKIKSCAPDIAVQVDKKKNKNKQSKNKAASSNQGMKQSSLTSFFLKQ